MRVLRMIHTIDPHSGGPIEGLGQASQIMLEAGVEIEVASLDTPASVKNEIDRAPWPVHALGPSKFGAYSYSPYLRPWLDQNLNRFDAVIIHGCWQYHGLAAAAACKRQAVPYYLYPHGMLDPWFNKTYPFKKLKKKLYWRWGEHRVLSGAAAVLFTCEEERRLARKSFQPYRVQENVIGYGTSTPDLGTVLDGGYTVPVKQPYFLFLGRVQEKKGVDLLVEAYSHLKAANSNLPDLVIAGPEQQPEYAAGLKKAYPSSSIHWIGAVDRTTKWPLLKEAEALILVSHQENFGLVVAESLAMGTPVLISDKVNIWREIVDEGAGLAASDTLDGASALLQKWIDQTGVERDAMKQASKEVFSRHFDIHAATLRLIDCLQMEALKPQS